MKQINLKQVNWMKALKIAGGGVAAILLAEALGLQNAASAGIITLLTVQNTRRETVMSSVRRLALARFFSVVFRYMRYVRREYSVSDEANSALSA